jgi:hypothetical protein
MKNASFQINKLQSRNISVLFPGTHLAPYQNKAECEKLYKTQAKRDKAPHDKNQR